MLVKLFTIIFLTVLNIVILSRVIWGPTGYIEYKHLKQQYASLQAQIQELDSQNMALSKEIRLLQSNQTYVEKMVRQKLHYLRNNELVYLFVNQSSDNYGGNENDRKN